MRQIKKICVITTSRAEYSLLKNLIKKINLNKYLKLQLIISGTHLSKKYGLTKKEILDDKIKIDYQVRIVEKLDNPNSISKSFSKAAIGFSKAYKKLNPDCIIYLGDRYEILAAAYTALIHNIPKIHIHGGEITKGIIDDATRHSITKISDFHFVSHDIYKKRVIQLGENPKNVFLVGAMAIENLKKLKILKKNEIYKKTNIKLLDNNFLITLHPVNLNPKSTKKTIKNLLAVLKGYKNFKKIFTYPNQDTYGKIIIDEINKFIKKDKNSVFVRNLGGENYLSLIFYSKCVIGNSSSGVIEVPSFQVPTLNIGTRQTGRVKAMNVIDVDISKKKIAHGLKKALSKKIKKPRNPFEVNNINPSEKIINFLKKQKFEKLNLEKSFYDI